MRRRRDWVLWAIFVVALAILVAFVVWPAPPIIIDNPVVSSSSARFCP